MCLILTVRLAEPDVARAADIGRAAGIGTCSRKWRLFGNLATTGILQIPGPDGGCGCSFLSDDASWSAPTWSMAPEALPRLTVILRTIREQASHAFRFEALWIGESPIDERRVTIDELVHLVQQSQLGTKTAYLVD
jgi:hypothetical protein